MGDVSPAAAPVREAPPLQPGRKFRGLDVVDVVGRGGMGTVFKARQVELDRFLALKILSPRLSRDPEFADRFQREAKAMAALDHPGIVRVLDFGKEGELFFLTMEYVEGVSLRDLIHQRRIAPPEALKIVPQICEALEYAHSQGIVHRDIKPENILLDRQGRVKIADFGLAKMRLKGEGAGYSTETDVAMGTPEYMAPEQQQRMSKVDHRADIYSLGVIFYEMLTGELPVGAFDPPSSRVQVDVRLDEIVLKAMEKRPDFRYQRVSDVKTDIETVTLGAPAPGRTRVGLVVAVLLLLGALAVASLWPKVKVREEPVAVAPPPPPPSVPVKTVVVPEPQPEPVVGAPVEHPASVVQEYVKDPSTPEVSPPVTLPPVQETEPEPVRPVDVPREEDPIPPPVVMQPAEPVPPLPVEDAAPPAKPVVEVPVADGMGYVSLRLGAWQTGEFHATTPGGRVEISRDALFDGGVDVGYRYGPWLFALTGDMAGSQDVHLQAAGFVVGRVVPLRAAGASEAEFSVGLLGGRFDVDASGVGDFDDAIGFQGRLSLNSRFSKRVAFGFWSDYRRLEFDYDRQVLAGDEAFLGSSFAMGGALVLGF